MSLITEINNVIDNYINNYINIISIEYNISDKSKLYDLWVKISNNDIAKTENKTIAKTEKTENKTIPKTENKGCPYVYIKGAKAGQNCGIKSKSSTMYCSTHKKYEGKEIKEKKIIPERNNKNINV